MISNILSLTKVLLKSSYHFNYNKKTNVTANKKILSAIGFIVLFLYIAASFGVASYGVIELLLKFEQEALFLGMFFIIICFLIVFQTIFTAINMFYFSKDISYILPLPLRPVEILAAKFNVIIIGEYLVEALFALSPLIIYGVLTKAGMLFYIWGVLILLIIPILPAIISCLLIMILMSFSKITKYKEKFQLVVGLIAIILAVGMQFFINKNVTLPEEQVIEALLQQNGTIELVNRYFITIKPAADILLNPVGIDVIINFAKILGVTILAYTIFIGLGSKLYLKGAIGNAESAVSGRGKKINLNKDYKGSNVGFNYVAKEIKILFRNPIYFMQCVLPTILVPVILIGSYFMADGQMDQIMNMATELNLESTMFVCIILGIIQFMCITSFISITAISRDGANATFAKYIPVSFYRQFLYKALPGIIINIIPNLIVLGILKYMLTNITIWYLITLFMISMIINVLENYLMLIVDLKRPKLNWSSEYAVVKQNMNMVFEFMLIILLIGIFAAIGYFLKDINYCLIIGIVSVIFGLITIFVDRYVEKNQEKLFEKIV